MSASSLTGPIAQRTYEGATSARGCGWGIPYSDGIVHVTVALVAPANSVPLIAALADSTEYTRTALGDIETFAKPITTGIGTNLDYAFVGPVWVIVEGTIVSERTAFALAAQAANSVLTANG